MTRVSAGVALPRQKRRRAGITRVVLASGLAAAGLWIGARTLGAQIGTSDVEIAASLNSGSAQANGTRSRRLLGDGEVRTAAALALEVLRRDSTVVPAVQTLGLAAQAAGDEAKSSQLLSYAQRLSRRDLQTHLWAIEHHVTRGDTKAVLGQYDLALRTSTAARDLLFPVLGGAIADPVVARHLIRRLNDGPLWRDAFLSFTAGNSGVAPATAIQFLEVARSADIHASAASLAVLVSRSLDAQEPRTAWRAYKLKRPGADVHSVRDPDFRTLPEEPAPFDWVLSDDGSVLARAGEQNSVSRLEVEAGSGAAGTAARQLQMLPPGVYRLVTDANTLSAGGEAAWSLTCQDGAKLTKLTIAIGETKRHVGDAFTVPALCDVQTLELKVDAGESPEGLRSEIRRVMLKAD